MIVGTGELGPGGSGASRFELEVEGELSAASIGELAWLCGLVRYERDGYRGRYVDAQSGDVVAEADLAARYGEAVAARTGVRSLRDDETVDASGLTVLTALALPADARLAVDDEAQARAFAAADPAARRGAPRPGRRHVACAAARRAPRSASRAVSRTRAAWPASSPMGSISPASACPETCWPPPTGWRS